MQCKGEDILLLEDTEWILAFVFLTDITGKLNHLNCELQGKAASSDPRVLRYKTSRGSIPVQSSTRQLVKGCQSNMATGVIRNLPIQASAPAYFPMIYQRSPCKEDEDEKLQEEPEEREDEEEEEEEEEDEEEECLAHYALDVTKQLLRFADLISRDVQRYFGRCGDQEACDIYSDSVSTTTSGRLRYYDDLLRIAGSPEEQETHAEDAKGSSSLGPLAELFDHRGPSQSRGQPMIKRHLPLSFWTEPMPCSSLVSSSNTPDNTHTHYNHNTHTHYNHNTHTLDGAQPDFSDLLANWDPNPDLGHTLTENSHMQQ
ncbi:protein PERCC1 isoform X2 [Amphiprion ocellaris]|uniref:protein PERCC1 isoform X2 n=1 Tax=Amphiprion ocellaris TaxID=80972 RepID=UPI002410FF5E|nr:protein PERCC1 isoform X2 [Amphiprion ocellaris]